MAENRIIAMSKEEIKRSEMLKMVNEKRITQKEGAQRIGISERHLRRLIAQYRESGPEPIVSKQRGKMSNNRMSSENEKRCWKSSKPNIKGLG